MPLTTYARMRCPRTLFNNGILSSISSLAMLDADMSSGESLDALFAQGTSLDSQVCLCLVVGEVGAVEGTGSQNMTDIRILL